MLALCFATVDIPGYAKDQKSVLYEENSMM